MERRSFILAALLGGALLAGGPSLAFAQPQARSAPPQGLGDMLRRPDVGAQAPVAARYVVENLTFTFDRSVPSLRFENGSEIIVLVRQAAPQGGAIYLNDIGEPVLKVSGLGGMTLFTAQRPQGIPVQFLAVAPPIRLESLRPGVSVSFWMQGVSSRITRLMGMKRQVAVLVDIDPKTSLNLVIDAITLAEEAFRKNAQRDRTKVRMGHIDTILVKDEGRGPAVRVVGDTLEITIDPAKGLAGRPSSERIARALAR